MWYSLLRKGCMYHMLLFCNCTNSNQQGAIGESIAEVFFRTQGFEVARMGAHAPYDMIVSKGAENKRIQIKTAGKSRGKENIYRVSLQNRPLTKTGYKPKSINSELVQEVFVVTGIGDLYLMPSNILTNKTDITLNDVYVKYKVGNVGLNLLS